MPDDTRPAERRGVALRTLLIAASVLVLLAAVAVALGPAAALAVTGLIAVVAGFVALVAGRAGPASAGGRRGAVAVLAVGGAGAFLGGTAFGAPLVNEADAPAVSVVATATPSPAAATALAALADLRVRPMASSAGYDRTARFGRVGNDVDRNGCDTRDDVLQRDLTERVLMHCRVLAGTLEDPYTGRTILYTRDPGASGSVRVDAVVALRDAWRTGARALPKARRVQLANDPLNLLAVSGTAHAAKGDRDAAGWLPERSGSRCAYVARQIAVKRAYGLWVTRPEAAAMRGVLSRCPGELLPGPALPSGPTDAPARTAVPATLPSPTPSATVVVRGGATCTTAGATAVNRSGTRVACLLTGTDEALRWRRAS